MRRRGSTGDLERLGKRRKLSPADEIVHAFVDSRLAHGVSEFVKSRLLHRGSEAKGENRLASVGRKLSALSKLPRSDLSNPRFVNLVNRMEIVEDHLDHKCEECEDETVVRILPSKSLIRVVQIRKLQEYEQLEVYFADAIVFRVADDNSIRCDPESWVKMERCCFGEAACGGASFLLRLLCELCHNPIDNITEQLVSYDPPETGHYLCYPFFPEFLLHLKKRVAGVLGLTLIPDLIAILVAYLTAPFASQPPNRLMWFKRDSDSGLHEYWPCRATKLRRKCGGMDVQN